jgi:uncharacterized protein YndB with AHSA1/START domain
MNVHSRKSVRSVELEDATSLAAGVRVAGSARSRISCVETSDAPVRSRVEVEIAAPPEVVWDVLTRLRDWPEWNPEVKSMSFDGPIAPGSEFQWKAGPGTIVSTFEQVEPPRRIKWRGRTMSINAVHEWRLEASHGGTRVETEESFSGLIARLFRRQLQKTLDKSLHDGLEHLKREAERRSGAASS